MSTINLPPTHNGHAPVGSRRDPADESCDADCDAAKIITGVIQDAIEGRSDLRIDGDCLETVRGGFVEFELPRLFVKVKRTPFAGQMANWSLEEVGLSLLSAARAAQVVEQC